MYIYICIYIYLYKTIKDNIKIEEQNTGNTGTSYKPTKIYGNYSKNTRSQRKRNKNLRELFREYPISAFKRNKNLKEIIGSTRIENGKVKKFSILSRTGKCAPCLSGTKTLCCNQGLATDIFTGQRAKGKFNIIFNLNFKSEYVIYPMECILCNRLEKQRQHLI